MAGIAGIIIVPINHIGIPIAEDIFSTQVIGNNSGFDSKN